MTYFMESSTIRPRTTIVFEERLIMREEYLTKAQRKLIAELEDERDLRTEGYLHTLRCDHCGYRGMQAYYDDIQCQMCGCVIYL